MLLVHVNYISIIKNIKDNETVVLNQIKNIFNVTFFKIYQHYPYNYIFMFGLRFIHTLALPYNYNRISECVITIILHLGTDAGMILYQNIKTPGQDGSPLT